VSPPTKQPTKRVALNARGVERVAAIAERHGVSTREYIEALLHYAISTDERPGSWEAQGFSFSNYDRRGDGAFADRWFDQDPPRGAAS
jgi:hypothetical protein